MEYEDLGSFKTLSSNVGQFKFSGKTVLIPEMNRIGCHLLAATFRGFDINALVMDTYKGIELGIEYSSGKECYPCQVTLGDVLYFMKDQEEKLGDNFNPKDYIYFMPEADGPCRFGMYNKYQRIVLDSFPGWRDLKIGSLTTEDGYSLKGIVDANKAGDLRRAAYFSVIVSDIMDRLWWRIRPYEKEEGMADEFMEKALNKMEGAFERYGVRKDFKKILGELGKVIKQAKTVINPDIPRKPLIGIVGEIYLRSHIHSNQDLIRVLEKHGAEVVNASIGEWVNYTTYTRLRETKKALRLYLKQLRLGSAWKQLKMAARYAIEFNYQQLKQRQIYKYAGKLIDLANDHKVGHLEEILKEDDIYTFDIGTEACLSIAGTLGYAREGYNGVVNVYPFTCMPSTVTSSIIKPLMSKIRVPYLDTPYDSSYQPGREADVRTFMYQVHQHMKGDGKKINH